MTDLERVERTGDNLLEHRQSSRPLALATHATGRHLPVLTHHLHLAILALDEVPPAEAEDEEHRLRYGEEHAKPALTLHPRHSIQDLRLEPRGLELSVQILAQQPDHVAHRRLLDPCRPRDERGDVAGGGDPSDVGLIALKQGARDEEALELVRERRVEGRVPEQEKLRVPRLERLEDQTVEDVEQRVELRTA